MPELITPWLEHVKGDTDCIVTGYSRIPVFHLGDGRIIMIDSGLAVPDRQGILDLLERKHLNVAGILTSHAHIDHTGNHKVIQEKYGAKIWMTWFDAAVSSGPMNMKAYMYSCSYHEVQGYAGSMYCRADCLIGPDDTYVDAEGARFEILRLPGHAPEHIGFVTPDGVAYLADALMTDDVLRSVHIPYVTCCELDLETKEYAGTLGYDCYIIAHNGVCADVRSLAEENMEYLREDIETVAGLIDHPMSMEEIIAKACPAMRVHADSVYKIDVAELSIRVFVEHLRDTGRLEAVAQDGVIRYVKTRDAE